MAARTPIRPSGFAGSCWSPWSGWCEPSASGSGCLAAAQRSPWAGFPGRGWTISPGCRSRRSWGSAKAALPLYRQPVPHHHAHEDGLVGAAGTDRLDLPAVFHENAMRTKRALQFAGDDRDGIERIVHDYIGVDITVQPVRVGDEHQPAEAFRPFVPAAPVCAGVLLDLNELPAAVVARFYK